MCFSSSSSMMWMCPCVPTFSRVWGRAVLIDPRRFVRQKNRKKNEKKQKKSCHHFLSRHQSLTRSSGLYSFFLLLLFLPGRCCGRLIAAGTRARAIPTHRHHEKYTISFFLSHLFIKNTKKFFLSLNLGLHIIIILVSTPPHPLCSLSKKEEEKIRQRKTKKIVTSDCVYILVYVVIRIA
jgi:hypothetical protein